MLLRPRPGFAIIFSIPPIPHSSFFILHSSLFTPHQHLANRIAARPRPFSDLTAKRFSGQYHEAALGLYFYNARWYDPLLGRFAQADTLIPSPGDPQAFNRYAYTLNNPLRYRDPSGHYNVDENGGGGGMGGGGGGGLGVVVTYVVTKIVQTGQGLYNSFVNFFSSAPESASEVVEEAEPVVVDTIETACGGGNCFNEVDLFASETQRALEFGQKAIEDTTGIRKITSQLMSKNEVLGIENMGNMSDLNNPQVQRGLRVMNEITSDPEKIWEGTWKGMKVYEYVRNGTGVVLNRETGELITVLQRNNLDVLNAFVENGTARWLLK